MRYLIIILMLSSSLDVTGQKEDHIWLFGDSAGDNSNPEVWLQDSTWGSTNIDFNYDPVKIYYDSSRVWDFFGTNASICDTDGNLKLYTNGQFVAAGDHTIIEDTINYNTQWDNWSYYNSDVLIHGGLPTMQGALILPLPESENIYYIFNLLYDFASSETLNMQYSIVEFQDDHTASVIERDVLVLRDTLASGSMNAVRHANGRDWWLLFPGDTNDVIHKYLFTPAGIEPFGVDTLGTPRVGGLGQMFFSPDGSKMAFSSWYTFSENGQKIVIMDFDRCTGEISDFVEQLINGSSFSHGVSFSPNGRFLYATDSKVLYQYDTESDDIIGSRLDIEEWDGFEYFFTQDTTPGNGRDAKFGWMALAPDGKIYISSTSGSSRVMHKINNPDILGTDCDMDQHSVYLPATYARTMPNFPHYRLGPLDGSSCDTLGLDNHPIAKYRYVQDTLEDLHLSFVDLSYFEPETYLWDFGDGTSSEVTEPEHTYESTGVYEVCLTVSNEYDTHTSCKTILLGTTATADQSYDIDISLYPNPVVDYLSISFHNYVALDAEVRFYNRAGIYQGSYPLQTGYNAVDIQGLPTGLYLYTILDGGEVLESGKVVKVR